MALKVGINGFGRIGRVFYRAALGHPRIRGRGGERPRRRGDARASAQARLGARDLRAGGRRQGGRDLRRRPARSACWPEKDPASLPWRELGVDVVVESTGRFVDTRERGQAPRRRAPEKVVITAPAKDPDVTRGPRGERADLRSREAPASSRTRPARPTASPRSPRCCSTASACAAAIASTVHSYTNDQPIHDFPHKDLRRARAGALSHDPHHHRRRDRGGAGPAALKGKLDGIAIRVPTAERVGGRSHGRARAGPPRSPRSTRRSGPPRRAR